MSVNAIARNLEDLYELTPLQEDNLRSYVRESGTGIFHESLFFKFEGHVDVDQFKRSWEKVLERHSVLRTSFYYNGLRKPLQAVHRSVQLPFELLDWRKFDSEQQQKKLDKLMIEDRVNDYDLNCAPLMRLSLFLLDEKHFGFWWRFHNLLLEGWSFALVINDFLQFYRSFYAEKKDPLVVPAASYRDYVAWLKQRDISKEQDFWRHYLENFTVQALIKSKTVPLKKNFTTIRQQRVDYDITESLKTIQKMTKEKEITVNAIFHGILFLLISRYTGLMDIITGATVSDRPMGLNDAYNRVGLYMNNLPIRAIIKPELKFVDWIKNLQSSMLQAFQFSSSSERDIKQYCNIPRNTPLFNSLFIFENMPLPDYQFTGLDFKLVDSNLESRPRYPINLFVWPNQSLRLKMIYDSKVLSEKDAKTFLAEMGILTERFCSNPELLVEDLLK